MESHDGIIYVTVKELTDESAGAPIISYDNYRQLLARRRITQGRQGKGMGSYALIVFESLPVRFKERYVEKYGDPRKHLQEAKETATVVLDEKARSFFEHYLLPDGSHIKGDKIDEFTVNASVLNELMEMENTQRAEHHKAGNSTPVNWPPIYERCEVLRDIAVHTLPKNISRLRETLRDYRRQGYAALVSGRLVNANACKMTDEVIDFLVALKCSRVPVYNNAQILERYNLEAIRRGWKTVKTQATITNTLNRPDVRPRWEGSALGSLTVKRRYQYQFATSLPTVRDALWYGDGTRLNLFYKAYVDGRYRAATLYVFEVIDAATEVFLGCNIGTTENFEMMREAYRDALVFAGHKPYELVSDNQGGTKRADAQEWLCKIATVFRPTAPHQPSAKTIESVFGRFQAQELHKSWFYTGGNVTARSEAARINTEMIHKNVDALPTYEQVVAAYMDARKRWNESAHPDVRRFAGRSRLDVYLSTENPATETLGEAAMRDLFWRTTARPSRFTPQGIAIQVEGEEYRYDVYAAPDVPDLDWRDRNTGREFYVQFDPRDMENVRLLTKDSYGFRFEADAAPYRIIPRALQDQTAADRRFIRLQDERNKVHAIRREKETWTLLVEHGMAPEQHGLVSPGITGFNENRATYQRLEERADAELRATPEEPAPAMLYPESEGRLTKEESLQTQYDIAAALDRL
jgi:hypothetical protein